MHVAENTSMNILKSGSVTGMHLILQLILMLDATPEFPPAALKL